MSSYVLDASVAAKWLLPAESEPLSREAVSLLEAYASGYIEFMVPDLFWAELGNILWKAVRRGRIPLAAAEKSIGAFGGWRIPAIPASQLLEDAVAIAGTFDRSVYDAIYVALAVQLNKPLVTADERLANALAMHFPVRWLGSFVVPVR